MISSFSIDKADYEPRRSSRSSNVNYHLSNEDDDSNDDGENSSDAGYSEELSEKSEEDDDDDEDWGANTKPKKIKLIKKKMLSKKNSTRKRRRQISSSSESAQSVVFSDIDLSQDSNDEDEGNSMRRQNSLFDIDDEDDDDDDDDDDDNDYVRKRQRTKIKHTVTRMSERRVKRKNYAEPSEVDQDLMISDEEEYIMQPSPTPDDDSIEAIEKILNVRNEDNDVCEYEVKWKNRAYLHTSWHTAEYLAQVKGFRILHNFQRAQDAYKKALIHCSPEEIEQVNITREMNAQRRLRFVIVDRIIAMRHNENDECEYMTKWLDLGYDCSTWETAETLQPFQKHIDDFLERERSGTKPRTHNNAYRKLKKQPEWMTAGVLRDYQLEGLNWLLFSEREKRNVILADEMGLGKTIQCISLIASLYTDYAHFGPYLVVVPLSTIAAWKRELQKWAPWMHVIEYRGNPSARAICRQYEWYRDGIARKRIAKFQVMLTNYEVVNKDKDLLSVFKWKYLIVDEAHRLKDNQSLLYTTLCGLKTTNRLLVTGTPLQNSLKELWCLLHFLEPKTFFSLDDFTERYGEIAQGGKQASNISSLHELLAPYLLRRTKKDVLKSLPAKTERILRVSMSALQRQYYRWVLSRNFNELNRGLKGSSSSSLSNTIMELKKVCNHPYLFANAESHGHSPEETVRQLILNSGKLELLDKLLLRLKENGHRVLIFSQMVRMLDILADYMTMRGFQYQRLDGSMNSESRQFSMDHFNADNSADFCFLLSTRAGGLGVNLATADTVVIFDSDWNPQNDLQAEARAHRIGQKKTVNIYRLVTKNSVEEDILERAKRKMILDHLVIQKMDTSGRGVLFEGEAARKQFDKRELMKIVQFGARALFKEEHASASGPGEVSNTVASTVSAKQNDVDLDDILARAETKLDQSNGPTNDTDEFLSAFKVANFVGDSSSTMAEDEEDSGTKQDDQFWQRVIPEHLRPVSEHDQDLVGIFMPRRARTAVKSYNEARIIDQNAHENDGNDFSDNEKDTSVSRQRRKKVPHSRASPARDSKQCYRALLQYGAIDVAVDFLLNGSMKGRTRKLLEDCMRDILQAVTNSSAISSKGTKAADSAEHKKDKGKLTKSKARLVVHGTVIDAAVLQQRITDMKILRDEIGDAREHYRVTVGVPPVRWKCPWGVRKDSLLLVGILQHGFGSWTQIFADKRLGLGSVIFKDGKQRVSNTQLLTRSRLLLRKLGQKHAKFSKTPSVFKMQSMKHKTSSDNHSLNPDKRSFNSALSPIKKQSQSKAMIKQPQENQSSMVVAKKTDVDVAALHDWCRESLMQRLEAMRAIKKLRLKLKESQGLDATPRDSKRYLLRIGDFITQTGDDAVCPHADAENVEREMWSITANLLDVEATLLSDLYWDVANVEDEVGIVKLFTTFAERRRPTIVKNVNDDR